MDVIALVVAILAFLLSLAQFFRDSSREKKEATLNAYNEIQTNALNILAGYPTPMPEIEKDSEDWKKLTGCLAALECFSVGVNTGIYSLQVVNRLGGSFLIHQYGKLLTMINLKRENNIVKGGHYDEFEQMVWKLERHRKNKEAAAERLKHIKVFFR